MTGLLLWPFVTIAAYGVIKICYIRFPRIYFTPMLVAPIAVGALILLAGVPYETYHVEVKWLSDLIGPATMALAVPLYKNRSVLKRHAVTIIASVFTGAVTAILSSVWMAKEFRLNGELTGSLAPHSATTPIAMSATSMVGGIPTVAAVLVLLTGILGMLLGPAVIRLFRIRHDIAKGVLLGTGAHAVGTSKAFELGPLIGSISSIAMILTALFTIGLLPWLFRLLGM